MMYHHISMSARGPRKETEMETETPGFPNVWTKVTDFFGS